MIQCHKRGWVKPSLVPRLPKRPGNEDALGTLTQWPLKSVKACPQCSVSKKGGNMDSEKLMLKAKLMV